MRVLKVFVLCLGQIIFVSAHVSEHCYYSVYLLLPGWLRPDISSSANQDKMCERREHTGSRLRPLAKLSERSLLHSFTFLSRHWTISVKFWKSLLCHFVQCETSNRQASRFVWVSGFMKINFVKSLETRCFCSLWYPFLPYSKNLLLGVKHFCLCPRSKSLKNWKID